MPHPAVFVSPSTPLWEPQMHTLVTHMRCCSISASEPVALSSVWRLVRIPLIERNAKTLSLGNPRHQTSGYDLSSGVMMISSEVFLHKKRKLLSTPDHKDKRHERHMEAS